MTSTPPSPSTTSATNHPSSSSSPTTGTATATATATSAGAATAPPSKPPSPPVHILATKPSRVYSFLHPVVLPLLLAARFAPLVADPVAELSGNLPLLAVLQVVFVVVCLPPAGSGYGAGAGAGAGAGSGAAAGTAAGGGAGAGRRRQHHGKGDLGLSSKVVPALISLTLTTLLATPAFTILLVLFGAPLTTHNFETILCAAHMAMLSATPLVYVHGVDGSTWREIWGVNRPTDAVWGGALGTGVGAWFGAVPIPLDWDRPWQAYPITILTGAYIGYAVGSLISRSSWLYGRRIQFVPEEDQKAEKVE